MGGDRALSAGRGTTTMVDVVPHTHWDREWYAPFQTFRLRLVSLLDDLLDTLESDPGYAHFLLDGQMAVIDDYLAVRPSAASRLARLAGAGRLAMGPWYTLPDEFLVSGETLVRNLQTGWARAEALGGAMAVGYLPDMFGHVAQMPQLLTQMGFDHAVVWRGVPAAVTRNAFWWHAPDGSTVRAEYLPQGYGNGARVPRRAEDLLARIEEFATEQDGRTIGAVLWMNGTDHQMPQPWLAEVVAEADRLDPATRVRIVSLAQHLAQAPTDGLEHVEGELRSAARANLLPGVASNRVDVKAAAAVAERSLEQLAEPLCTMARATLGPTSPRAAWPAALLDAAWLEMLRNSAHDSICACSHDEVVDAVLVRYAEATRIAEGLAAGALEAIATSIAGDGPVVVNPSGRTRAGVVEVLVPGEEAPPLSQELGRSPADRLLTTTDLATASVMVAEMEYLAGIEGFRLETAGAGAGEVLLEVRRAADATLITPALRARLEALRGARGGEAVAVHVTGPPTVTVLAATGPVPGLGWAPLPSAGPAPGPPIQPVVVTDTTMSNGLVEVALDAASGTFCLDGTAGMGLLVDGGDVGDTYNWCPPPHDELLADPEAVQVEVLERGPLRARMRVRRRYRWPACVEAGRRVGDRAVEVDTTLELRAGADVVGVTIELDNHGVRDHRLRLHLPLPQPATASEAECAFAVVRRGLQGEGGPTEAAVGTFPSRRFVRAGGLTVVHEGPCEYELVDVDPSAATARTLAVTLVRATGMLSQGSMATRPLPAGPLLALEGPQLQRRVRLRLALHTAGRDPFAVTEDALVPLPVVLAGGGTLPRRHQVLSLGGATLSALTHPGDGPTVRVHNPTPQPVTVTLEGRRGRVVDLQGRPVSAFTGSLALGPWKVATVELDADGAPAREPGAQRG